jgi:hypothetical protein
MHLNIVKTTTKPTLEDDDCFFGKINFANDAIMSSLIYELQIF